MKGVFDVDRVALYGILLGVFLIALRVYGIN